MPGCKPRTLKKQNKTLWARIVGIAISVFILFCFTVYRVTGTRAWLKGRVFA
jgi:hypothetical protein